MPVSRHFPANPERGAVSYLRSSGHKLSDKRRDVQSCLALQGDQEGFNHAGIIQDARVKKYMGELGSGEIVPYAELQNQWDVIRGKLSIADKQRPKPESWLDSLRWEEELCHG